MKRLSFVITAVAVLLALSGCSSGPTTYASPSALQKAYVKAGGSCPDPTDVPESMVGAGAHAVLCPNVTMLLVFDSDEAKNRYLAQVLDGSSEMHAIAGTRWVMVADNASRYADALGGKIENG